MLMLIGYLLIALWALLLFSFRSQTTPFISVWYLVAALFWFPWSFVMAHAAHVLPNVSGVVQNLVAAWATQNFQGIWLTSIGLAAAYYLIPKVVNRRCTATTSRRSASGRSSSSPFDWRGPVEAAVPSPLGSSR
ncbi:MAG: hypothetical protein WDN28_21680 [Chthoniobacter sp.]